MGVGDWFRRITSEQVSAAAAVLGVVALAVGGAFGAIEYLERKEADRAERTLEFIDRWESDGLREIFVVLNREIAAQLNSEARAALNDPERGAVARDNIARRAMAKLPDGSYEKIVYFFTRLSLCIQADLCSAPVARTFFQDSLTDFEAWFVGEIERRRTVSSRHAVELDTLVEALAQPD